MPPFILPAFLSTSTGPIACKLRASAMGAELDNLSDLISFGLAPAYFVVTWGMVAQDAHQRVSVVAAVFFLLHARGLVPFGLIWVNHIGVDRLLGYGLKYSNGFGWTHLGIKEKQSGA